MKIMKRTKNISSLAPLARSHRAAGVTTASPWRVHAMSVLPGYRLSVTCNDATSGGVDMYRLGASEQAGIYAALKDETTFNQVDIEPGALNWPNGADLDPEWLHQGLGKNKTWLSPINLQPVDPLRLMLERC